MNYSEFELYLKRHHRTLFVFSLSNLIEEWERRYTGAWSAYKVGQKIKDEHLRETIELVKILNLRSKVLTKTLDGETYALFLDAPSLRRTLEEFGMHMSIQALLIGSAHRCERDDLEGGQQLSVYFEPEASVILRLLSDGALLARLIGKTAASVADEINRMAHDELTKSVVETGHYRSITPQTLWVVKWERQLEFDGGFGAFQPLMVEELMGR